MNERLMKRMAQAYGKRSKAYAFILEPTLQPMAAEILRIGAVSKRDRIMDLATGTGLIARAAALVSSSVIGVDISPGVLVAARESSAGDTPFVVADAGALPFGDRSFNLVTCGLGLSHFPDVVRALGEVRRVLCPGGRFVASAWGSEEDDQSFSAALDVLDRYRETNPFAELLDEETWANSEQGCEVLQRTGFAEVRATTIPLSGIYRNPCVAIEWAFAWPLIGEYVDSLDPNPTTRNTLRAEATAAVDTVNDLGWKHAINYYEGRLKAPVQ